MTCTDRLTDYIYCSLLVWIRNTSAIYLFFLSTHIIDLLCKLHITLILSAASLTSQRHIYTNLLIWASPLLPKMCIYCSTILRSSKQVIHLSGLSSLTGLWESCFASALSTPPLIRMMPRRYGIHLPYFRVPVVLSYVIENSEVVL